jgi:hypothetical protein
MGWETCLPDRMRPGLADFSVCVGSIECAVPAAAYFDPSLVLRMSGDDAGGMIGVAHRASHRPNARGRRQMYEDITR